jgi:hypothetical protein
MTINTTTQLNSLYNDIYDRSLMVLREENLFVSGGLITVFQAQGAATRTVPIWSKASVQTVNEGTDFAGHSTFEKTSKATFTPLERAAGFIITDRMIATDPIENIVGQAANELGGALAEQVDIDVAAEFANFSNGKGSAGSALSLSLVAAGIASIVNAKVKGNKSVVLHPFQWHDIWVELGQPVTNNAFLGDTANEALRNYTVARMEGATWYTSANITVNGSDDAYGAVFTRDALAYDSRRPFTLEQERDASLRGTEWTASMDYDTGVLRQEAGRYLLSDAAEPTGF